MTLLENHGFVEGQLYNSYQLMRRSALEIWWALEYQKPKTDKLIFEVQNFLQGYDRRLPEALPIKFEKPFNFMLKIVDPLDDMRSLLDIFSNDTWVNHRAAIWYRIGKIMAHAMHPRARPKDGYFAGLVLPYERYPGIAYTIEHIFTDGTFVRNNGDYSLAPKKRSLSSKPTSRRARSQVTHMPNIIEPMFIQNAIGRCEEWKFPELHERHIYIHKFAEELIKHQVLKKRDPSYIIPDEFKPLTEIIQGPPMPWYGNTCPTSWLEVLGAQK